MPHSLEGATLLGATVSKEDGWIYLRFGQPITWYRMTPEQALVLADAIRKYAAELGPTLTKP